MSLLRVAALSTVPVGAAGAVALTLYTGRRNPSWLLMALFAFWVLSPFAALQLANVASKRYSFHPRAALYAVMLVVALGTLAVYGYVAFGPPRQKTAAVFVVTPPVSWLLIAAVAAITAHKSRRAR
ncbi:MAG: hypothetical protein ABSC93_15075 [Bryobacteraceae bacterium]|jgi:ACR3 family arsenite efflux pump ArsB